MATNEEFERKMSFIVEQQAQFASDIQQLRESQTETNQIIARSGDVVTHLASVTLEGFRFVNAKIDALVDSQKRTDEQLQRTDEQLRQTDEQLQRTDENVARTDESLRNLIDVVNRHFDEGRPEA
ncbi:MAG TPA: hypothetical protein VJU86_05160 [Pyrinomonadaceae bacterium]|nr:hypothetical protein [Pyrinomonadaceae bacterium]